MHDSTSLKRIGGKVSDLNNIRNEQSARLKAKGTSHKHCTLIDKYVPHNGTDNNSETSVLELNN